jgi:polyhydroxyalkanoate synthesis regulator phasin
MRDIEKPREITRENVDRLKQQWLEDGCWDLEETEGFEEFHDELRAFRQKVNSQRQRARIERLEEIADNVGLPNNLHMAEFVEELLSRLDKLEEQVADLSDRLASSKNKLIIHSCNC